MSNICIYTVRGTYVCVGQQCNAQFVAYENLKLILCKVLVFFYCFVVGFCVCLKGHCLTGDSPRSFTNEAKIWRKSESRLRGTNMGTQSQRLWSDDVSAVCQVSLCEHYTCLQWFAVKYLRLTWSRPVLPSCFIDFASKQRVSVYITLRERLNSNLVVTLCVIIDILPAWIAISMLIQGNKIQRLIVRRVLGLFILST